MKKFLLIPLLTIALLGNTCTVTPEQRALLAEPEIAAKVCSVWKPQTYSRHDTPETKAEIRQNNAVRSEFCK